MPKKNEIFDVNQVALEGTNLVEASAGTGKTYSIAILVLRLIIEKGIGVQQQLIVTFTRFAVAELQERVRHFIKMAYDASCGLTIKDELINQLVQSVPDMLALKDRLRGELLMMDEANILTIHGFCQQMLNEFAFETKQHFDAALQSDLNDIVATAVNQFWREVVTNLPVNTFSIKEMDIFKAQLPTLFYKHLGGLQYAAYDATQSYDVFEPFLKIGLLQQELAETTQSLSLLLLTQRESVAAAVMGNAYAKKALVPLLDDASAFIEAALNAGRKGTAYIQKLEGAFWDTLQQVLRQEESLAAQRALFQQYLSYHALRHYAPKVTEYIHKNGILTFDAMIEDLHRIVVKEKNEYLCSLIRARYAAVFIDEFQDTDTIQFELFEQLFMNRDSPNETILFLIGDPKQSIYAFRNADVDSYLAAKQKVDKVYSMNVNYRSTARMVQSVNYFFSALGTQAFGYEDAGEQSITYIPVEGKDQVKAIQRNHTPDQDTLVLAYADKVGDAKQALAKEIAYLLNPENGCTIDDGSGGLRAIVPSDIGILVRTGKDGADLKKILRAYNILAVPIDDTRVLQTKEAGDMMRLLQAMLAPTVKNIASALYLSFINTLYYEEQAALLDSNHLDEIALTALFKSYHQLVLEQKVYQAFQKLLSDFSIAAKMSKDNKSLRALANIIQLMQLMHQQQYRRNMNADDLLLWLQNPEAAAVSGDAYEVQLESDDNAVSIVTIHKSKGLEYNIVFVYGIHTKETVRNGFNHFKDREGKKKFIEKEWLREEEEALLLKQAEQEQRRLMYVALTRAVYKCYIFYTKTGHNNSGLYQYLQQLQSREGLLLDYTVADTVAAYVPQQDNRTLKTISYQEQAVLGSKSPWNMVSYSALNVKHDYVPKSNSNQLADYDAFVFNELPRGTEAGTLLHTIFEQLDFTKDYSSLQTLGNFEKMHLSGFNVRANGTLKTDRTDLLRQLVYHTLHATIRFADNIFELRSIANHAKINELEFNFPLQSTAIQERLLPLLQSYGATLNDKYFSLSGMMNGKIDLLFEQQGQYYILDWKSNYLGFDIADYEREKLYEAMTEHNYHLQYLIYTVAVHKYLQQRMGSAYQYEVHFGGIVYVFLRGVRSGQDAGIFTIRPPFALIEALADLFFAPKD
ncbi:hypothetical protein DBR32_06775 [Taibaiella sp. KBW10]|uniref:UvrD-helicase domain-containing protein n=1 Tax=Taibaiella sp. KBW10 TaxID=2153357 RepID=UPI000F5A40A3|nr:UvrD-helicase domain-containing protein [Taibaiella sp. KBW10]RQO31649.1 hypothetical protein DBR32_06775 [Taibaiella sp. KBW10]